jgi:hypothetical protein
MSNSRGIAMDSSQINQRIKHIKSQLDKDIHDVTTMVVQNYVEYLPQTMFMPLSFAVEQGIARAKGSISTIQVAAEDVERQLGDTN